MPLALGLDSLSPSQATWVASADQTVQEVNKFGSGGCRTTVNRRVGVDDDGVAPRRSAGRGGSSLS
jgi:hypothetical protein